MSVDEVFDSCFDKDLWTASILEQEIEEGNVEYKYKLTDLNDEQYKHRSTQMNWRLNEGHDEAIYQIGVEDDGNPLGITRNELKESLVNLEKIAYSVGCDGIQIKSILKGSVGYIAEIFIRRLQRKIIQPIQIKIAVAGDFDSGKSTLIGVLSTGKVDNGKGLARMHVFQHNHEICSGRTSSISQHNLYFDTQGKVLNVSSDNSGEVSKSNILKSWTESEMTDSASRIVSFLDLAGHTKYLKTTLHGLVARAPDTCLLCVSAKRGIQSMTTEHLGVIFALQLGLAIVITKADLVNQKQLTALIQNLIRLLSNKQRQLVVIDSIEQLDQQVLNLPSQSLTATLNGNGSNIDAANNNNGSSSSNHHVDTVPSSSSFSTAKASAAAPVIIIPIFVTSSVSTAGLDILSHYFFSLPHVSNNSSNIKSNISEDDMNNHINNHDDNNRSSRSNNINSTANRNNGSYNDCSRMATNSAQDMLNLSSNVPPTHDTSNSSSVNTVTTAVAVTKTLGRVIGSFKCHHYTQTNNSQDTDYIPSVEAQPSSFFTTAVTFTETVFLVIVQGGSILTHHSYYFGPFTVRGSFLIISIKSIRVNNVPVESAVAGQTATITIVKGNGDDGIRRSSYNMNIENDIGSQNGNKNDNSRSDAHESNSSSSDSSNVILTPQSQSTQPVTATATVEIMPAPVPLRRCRSHSMPAIQLPPTLIDDLLVVVSTSSSTDNNDDDENNSNGNKKHAQHNTFPRSHSAEATSTGMNNSNNKTSGILNNETSSVDQSDSAATVTSADDSSHDSEHLHLLTKSVSTSIIHTTTTAAIIDDTPAPQNQLNLSSAGISSLSLATRRSRSRSNLDHTSTTNSNNSSNSNNTNSNTGSRQTQSSLSTNGNSSNSIDESYLKQRPLNGLVFLSINPSPPSLTSSTQQQSSSPILPPSSPTSCSSNSTSNKSTCATVPIGCWEFEAELLILNHPSKVKVNYEPVVMIDSIEQSARIIAMARLQSISSSATVVAVQGVASSKKADLKATTSTPPHSLGANNGDNFSSSHHDENSNSTGKAVVALESAITAVVIGDTMKPPTNTTISNGSVPTTNHIVAATAAATSTVLADDLGLGNGSKAICRFRFLYHPEYIVSGSVMLIREGRTRGVGHVIRALPNVFSQPQQQHQPQSQHKLLSTTASVSQ